MHFRHLKGWLKPLKNTRKRLIISSSAVLLVAIMASAASHATTFSSNDLHTSADNRTKATTVSDVPKDERNSNIEEPAASTSLSHTVSDTAAHTKSAAAPTNQKDVNKKQDTSTALPKATVAPLPGSASDVHNYVNPNFTIHVTKTGAKSLAWTSDYTAAGYFLRFQLVGDCSGLLDIPCTAPPIYTSGTTSGSYAFTYAQGKTYGMKALVTVCVNENISNCGMTTDNYAYLDF